jgi:hypothetical protein
MGISPIADMDVGQTIVAPALAAKSSAEMPRNAFWEVCPGSQREISSPQLRHDNHGARGEHGAMVHAVLELSISSALLYSSWRRHQTPVSLRPFGARSSHWYMPQRPSSPRA